jgi:hypothetical protein
MERFDFEFHNHTGHVLTERGLLILLRAVKELHHKDKDQQIVANVPCMRGISITVVVNRHGMATKR